MTAYNFTLICAGKRTTRKIIAHSTMQASCIGIRMSPSTDEPVRIICKPVKML